jgi:hypothetical protein
MRLRRSTFMSSLVFPFSRIFFSKVGTPEIGLILQIAEERIALFLRHDRHDWRKLPPAICRKLHMLESCERVLNRSKVPGQRMGQIFWKAILEIYCKLSG